MNMGYGGMLFGMFFSASMIYANRNRVGFACAWAFLCGLSTGALFTFLIQKLLIG